MSLACEDGNSKLVDAVTVADLLSQLEVRNRKGAESGLVADVDDEDCIGNSLLQIWELRIVHKAKLLFRL